MSEYLTYLTRGTEIIAAAQREIEINVTAARILGDSWADIGAALGISRQAAWERFATTREKGEGDPEIPGQTRLDHP